MLRVCVCDDDRDFVDGITDYIQKNFDDLEVAHVFTSADEVLARVDGGSLEADLFLLDIKFDGEQGDGIDLAKRLNDRLPAAQIVFVSNYPGYISDVYEASHCWFVVKSSLERYLPAAVERAKRSLERSLHRPIVIAKQGEKAVVYADSIVLLERNRRTTRVALKDGVLYTSSPLSEIIPDELGFAFVRCHNSFIASLRHVKSFSRSAFVMDNGERVPISRSRAEAVKRAFARYMCERL